MGDNDFRCSGLQRLSTVNWQNERHQRSIMASLVKGVYVQEDDRQQKRQGCLALAPPWWEFFNFVLLEVLVDDDASSISADFSIFGAVYEFTPSNNYYPVGAPRYVIAFRGTMLKKETIVRDTILDINVLTNNLSRRSRSDKAMQAVENRVSGKGDSRIWLAGHSLGASLAMLVGKNMARKGNFLESYFFNPPFVAAPMKRRIRKARTWIKAGLTVGIKDYQERQRSKSLFNNLCKWVPKLFLHESDLICAGYVGDFELRESMESDGVGDVGRLAAQNTMRGIFTGALGMDSILNLFGINCSDDLHSLASACLTTSCIRKFQSHNLSQWFTDETVSDSKVYSTGGFPKPAISQTDNPEKTTTSCPPPLVGQATMFEIAADVSTLYGCGNFELVYNFWVPPEHKDFYTQIVETYGHIPTLLAGRHEMNTFVNVTRLLLDAAVEMTHLGESFPSEEKLSSWRSALDHARFFMFNISWLEELFKEIEKKRDSQQELLRVEVARLKKEVASLQLTRVPLVQEAAEVEVKIRKRIYYG
ncbi:hypothetical protein C5167_029055 [Papaver somniferum]|uniref:GDSL esterase/lipase At4g10955-like n=1 Tax=Papaver somniferum TaxID=3469 RepID=UPI000E701706|nr:GDSL esterase/lipase At4g10955-like [Papaver somniferum]RZC89992.1 hypothetical protein C5167_029055 [Papaver somniferum]